MCSLISERPNLVPTGIGNSNSAIDMNILLSGDVMMGADDLDEMATPDEQSGSDQDDMVQMGYDEDIGIQEKPVVKKEKLVILKKGPNSEPTKKTKVPTGSFNPTTSTSTPARPSSTKPKNIMERFSEVAKIEEETAQKQLELKKFQVKSTNKVAVVNIQVRVHLRVE